MNRFLKRLALASLGLLIGNGAPNAVVRADDAHIVHTFKRIQLTDVYYSEGANYGDIDGDGKMDVVYGPHWYAGPDFKTKHEIYPARAQRREGYSDHFFAWLYDFNGDGRQDVFVVGFPATPAYVYENPGKEGFDKPWPKHQVFDQVSNESPHFTQVVGDDKPELICTHDGNFGYATIDWKEPWKAWTFHVVSDKGAPAQFGHGLGVGDVNGDGRIDILMKDGWYEQPDKLDGDPKWTQHNFQFAKAGGAEMYAYDVDGDGDNDVITSLAAHDFGLAWFEQIKDGKDITFRKHLIMGSKPAENKYGLVFSELHSVALADIDGDGLKDIVTGKTYWSHHTQSPMWDAGAVVYWFKLVRTKDGVDWLPYRADDDSGIGRQVTVGDVSGDKLPDIVVGGMKGAHVLIHQQEKVDQATWEKHQPKAAAAAPKSLPDSVDLRPEFAKYELAPRSQGRRNTCSVFTTVAAYEFALAKHDGKGQPLSVEYLNWATNQVIGNKTQDRGQFFHDLLRAFDKYGMCADSEMPYARKFDPALAPSSAATDQATKLRDAGFRVHWLQRWSRQQGISDDKLAEVKQILASGFPVAAGSDHSRLLVGYRNDTAAEGGGAFITRDSAGGKYREVSFDFARQKMNDLFWVECSAAK